MHPDDDEARVAERRRNPPATARVGAVVAGEGPEVEEHHLAPKHPAVSGWSVLSQLVLCQDGAGTWCRDLRREGVKTEAESSQVRDQVSAAFVFSGGTSVRLTTSPRLPDPRPLLRGPGPPSVRRTQGRWAPRSSECERIEGRKDITELVPEPPRALPPAVPVWLWPAVMLVLTAVAFAGAHWQPSHSPAVALPSLLVRGKFAGAAAVRSRRWCISGRCIRYG